MSSAKAALCWTLVASLMLLTACSSGRPPPGEGDDPNAATTFAKSYGGEFDDVPVAAVETEDGGYAFVGTRGDVPDPNDPHPTWLVRLDGNGNVLWQNTFSENAFGGLLGRRPFNLLAAAVPGGGFCLAGTVEGQPGDTGDIYVGFMDAQDNVVWEVQFDSGGWNGYEVVASGDRGAFAHDQPLAVRPGPDQSCYVGAASIAHLRDSFGVGIRNTAGTLLDEGGTFIDARSLVFARADSSGMRWLRRDTEGAFDDPNPLYRYSSWSTDVQRPRGVGFISGVDLQMVSTPDGGLATASILEDGTSTEESRKGVVVVNRYDASGTPDRVLTRRNIEDLESLLVTAIGADTIVVEDASDRARMTRVAIDGSERWNRDLATLNAPVAVHFYQDASGPRIASFGGDGLIGQVVIFDAANGDILNVRQIPGTLTIEAAAPLQTPGRFLAMSRVMGKPREARLQELDLQVSDVLVAETLTDLFAYSIQVDAGVAYKMLSTELQILEQDGSLRTISLRPDEAMPVGLVELANDRFGVAIRRGGSNTQDVYLIVDRDGVEHSTTLAFDATAAKIDGIAPGRRGGAALLVRHTGPDGAQMRSYTVVEVNDSGGTGPFSDTFRAAAPWQTARLRQAPGGGYAAMFVDGEDFRTQVVQLGADGTVRSGNAYFGTWLEFEPLRDGGYALTTSGFRGDELFRLMRTNASGEVLWERSYHVTGLGQVPWVLNNIPPVSVRETADGALVVAVTSRGLLNSGFSVVVDEEGDVTRTAQPLGETNIAMVRLDADGTPEWVRVHGALLNETLTHMTATRDGGFLVSAVSDSLGQPSAANERLTNEAWLLRMGPDGVVTAGCNAYLAELSASVFTLREREVSLAPVVLSYAPPPDNVLVITETLTGFSANTPPIVEARQCAGIAATGNSPAPDARLWDLTVNQAGSIDGLVISSPTGIFCGGADPQACSRAFADGSSAFLTVDDSSAPEFRGWGDGCETVFAGPDRCQVRMNADRTVDVFFEPWDGTTATLNVDVIGAGRVVAFEPTGIDCYDDATASDCTETYRLGQRVLLSISAQPGESFQGWGGACASWATAQTIRVTVDSDQTCTAQFTGVGFTPRYRLSTAISLEGVVPVNTTPGSILSSPGGAECGAPGDDCMGDYDVGAIVQLAARAATDYQFTRWTSSVAGSSCDGATTPIVDVMLNSDVDCTADFTFAGGNVAILNVGVRLDGVAPPAAGPFGGNVTSTPAGINCGSADSDCVEGYVRFTAVALTATADTGYRFSRWAGDCSSSISTTTVAMNGDRSCTAEFVTNVQPGTATLDIVVNGGGTVVSNPAGIDCGNDCTEAYPLLTVVDLVAAGTPTEPFLSWGGDCSGGSNTQVTMNLNRQCIANFAPVAGTFRLTINVVGNGTVSTLDSGIACPGDCIEDYPANARTIVDAIPGAGERLVGWTGDCLDLADATQFSLTMFRDWNCTATFAP